MSSIVVAGDTSGSITISAPAVSGSNTLSLPAVTDTLVGKATTDTLTNKTLTSPTLTSPALGTVASGVISACTSSGMVMVTPVLGTPTSGNLANCTGVPASALPAGSVLQVVQAVKTATQTITGTTQTDVTGLSVVITPRSASNKILVLVDMKCGYGIYGGIANILRNGTKIYVGDGGLARSCAMFSNAYTPSNAVYHMLPLIANYLDSPATTSALTYKVQAAAFDAGQVQYINRTDANLNETGRDGLTASSITVMEIAG